MSKLLRLLTYARPYLRGFTLLGILTVAMPLLAALQPWPMKLLVDNVLGEVALPTTAQSFLAGQGIPTTREALLLLVVAAGLILFAVHAAVDALTIWGWTVFGRRLVYGLAEDLFAKLQRRSLLVHSRVPVGDTIERIAGDSWTVHDVLDSLVFSPLMALLTLGAMLFLMLQLDPVLTVVALAAAPAAVAASTFAGRPLREVAETRRRIKGEINAHVQQTLSGIPVVQGFGREEHQHLRFRRFAEAVIRAQQRNTLIGGLNELGTGFVAAAANAAVLWIAALQVLRGDLTIGGMLVFIAYLGSLQAQISSLARIYPALQGMSARLERVDEILRTEPEVFDRPGAVALPAVRGEVRFEEVSFAYEPGRPVLKSISFCIAPGETLALVGPTGSGKSTLVSLIPRFFDPTAGRVLIDGHDLREVQLASLRRQVALVLQEPFLFPISVAENIAYGRPEARMAEIEAAARAANAHDFIMRLPEGYATILGERGGSLSGGERQRLSIARALLKDAPILVLDEPTSALDAETEHLVITALQRLMAGRTTIIIAHRLSTVRRAERVMVIRDGSIAEIGPHEELMRRAGLYARYVQLQQLPTEAEANQPAGVGQPRDKDRI